MNTFAVQLATSVKPLVACLLNNQGERGQFTHEAEDFVVFLPPVYKFGFPRTRPKAKQSKHGFRTGDQARAVVPVYLAQAGTYTGRMSAKSSGYFTISTPTGSITILNTPIVAFSRKQTATAITRKECGIPSRHK